uniref:Uncharacterized protein n=1 Tax=Anguilla anguilla TaxID=7936 RepID=A0A0E9WXN9_ANGAN
MKILRFAKLCYISILLSHLLKLVSEHKGGQWKTRVKKNTTQRRKRWRWGYCSYQEMSLL